ncbi:MAG: putative membrane protein YjcC [Candidatus Omnitrophica bacterium ADurb.Bin277]|nr:MAG: putative membrane protein YjcC [Candidatus Omnitrophica bacterium ADurb.Bin277]
MKFILNLFKKHKPDLPENIYSVYQPIVDIATWDVIGHEAFARSEKETPVEMFQRSYEKGTVIPFDFRCLAAAIKILPAFPEGQYLFLNIEPLTLERAFEEGKEGDSFLRHIKTYSGKVVFEVTEGVKKSDFAFIKKGVDFIRTLGYRFALDDLSEIGAQTLRLASLKPDFFKVDMHLIQGISNNYMNQQIVREMAHLGRMNGAEMIVEGIESKEDCDFMSNMGIRYGQGFYFARPAREPVTFLQPPKNTQT